MKVAKYIHLLQSTTTTNYNSARDTVHISVTNHLNFPKKCTKQGHVLNHLTQSHVLNHLTQGHVFNHLTHMYLLVSSFYIPITFTLSSNVNPAGVAFP